VAGVGGTLGRRRLTASGTPHLLEGKTGGKRVNHWVGLVSIRSGNKGEGKRK